MAGTPGDPHASPAEGSAPRTILGGKYRIERAIGEGAFGRVYLAFDPLLRRNAAIKELLAGRTTTGPALYERYLERFRREARAAGRIEHPNVVGVYELAVALGGDSYLVMQYVDGTNLRDLLARVGSLPVERAVAIALDIAQGLVAVHEQGIVHRDLKPANIMLTGRGAARITDFGVAQVDHESLRTQAASGHPGTPLYMSPEQSSGMGYIDGRSDLYSLGLILYAMLVGEPYARRRQPLMHARPDLPPGLHAIVTTLIEPDPARRFQGASDVVAALRQPAISPAIPVGDPDIYPLPDRTVPRGTPEPPPSSWPADGVPEAYGGAPPAIVGAPDRAPPPVRSPGGRAPDIRAGNSASAVPPAPERARVLARRHVRARPGHDGLPEYVVDGGAILRRVLALLVCAVALWLGLGVAGSGHEVGTTGYTALLTCWIVVTVCAPIGLAVTFFALRSRAKAAARDLQQRGRR